jgi:hypothetical protein
MLKLRVWLPAVILAAAFGTAVALHVAWQKPPPPPRSTFLKPMTPSLGREEAGAGPTELLAEYHNKHIDVQTTPSEDGWASDAYLFFDAAPDALRMCQLPDAPEYADCWSGVILARFVPDRRLDAAVLSSWGDCGMRSGQYLLFGDPIWINKSRDVLPQA